MRNRGNSVKQNIIKIYLCFIVALLTVFGGNTYKAMAEGSITINPDDKEYRIFMEYQYAGNIKNQTVNQDRKQVVYVYAKAGETVYFGSSVTNSTIDASHFVNGDTNQQYDIVVHFPQNGVADGETRAYSVSAGNGLIQSRTEEKAGPSAVNPNGYKTGGCSFVAPRDGLYEFHFHSQVPNRGDLSERDPSPQTSGEFHFGTSTTGKYQKGQGQGCVGAWDVTVVGTDNEVKNGRMFTYMIAWNTGANTKDVLMSGNLYAASSEGFIYKTTFDHMNPWGFIFYGDEKGIMYNQDFVDNQGVSHKKGESVYGTYYGPDNQMKDFNASHLMLSSKDDNRFMIFFNEPSADIPESILPKAVRAPKPLQNLSFLGSLGNHQAYVGEGGDFVFDVPANEVGYANISSVMITIDFSDYDIIHNTKYGVVNLQSSAVTPGVTNSIHWDGKGANGENIPAGVYNDQSVHITASTRGGEYHFVLIDVEENKKGLVVERLTPILDSNGNEINESEDAPYKVYYNADVTKTIRGVDVNKNAWSNYADDGKSDYRFDGMDSRKGAVKFVLPDGVYDSEKDGKYNDAANTNSGDRLAVDIWTYVSLPVDTEFNGVKEFEIIELKPDYKEGSVDINFHKVDKDNTGKSLENAVYGVYSDPECNNKIDEIITNEEGNTKYTIKANETVYIKEITPPSGYELDPNVYTYSLIPEADGPQKLTLNVYDLQGDYNGRKDDKGTYNDSSKAFDLIEGTNDENINTYYDGIKGGYASAKVEENQYYITKIEYYPRSDKTWNSSANLRLSEAMFDVSNDYITWRNIVTLPKREGTDYIKYQWYAEKINYPTKGAYLRLKTIATQENNIAAIRAYGLPATPILSVTGNANVAYNNLKDGNNTTGVTLAKGQYAVADLGALYEMTGVYVLPVNGQEAKLGGGRLEVSVDGENWSFVAPFGNKDFTKPENCYFSIPASARYIRVSAPSGEIAVSDIVALGIKYNLLEGTTILTPDANGNFLKTLTDIAKQGFFLKIFKNDEKNQPLPGAYFGLFADGVDTSDVSKATENIASVDGVITYATEFVIGNTYYLKETSAPTGYKLDDTLHKLVVTSDGICEEVDGTQKLLSKDTADNKYYLTLTNELKSFLLEIIKSDSADGTIKLPGAVFSIYENVADITSGATAYDTLTTAETTGLAVGTQPLVYGKTYYLVETQAPTGYVLDSNTVHVLEVKDEGICKVVDGTSTLLDNGTTPLSYAISLTNNKKTFLLKLIKQSLADENALLPNAVFGLYTSLDDAVEDKADGKIILTTEANGTIQLTDANALIYGKTYYIKETQAPEGYIVDLTIHTLKIEDDGIYEVLGDTKTKLDDTSGIAVMRFKNIPELELPVTGAWFTGDVMKLLGLLIFAVCGSALVARRKMNA